MAESHVVTVLVTKPAELPGWRESRGRSCDGGRFR
jgi:hypothetical protein